MQCPRCTSEQILKNGCIHNGKAKDKCKAGRRQFVEDPQWRPVSDETKIQLQKLLHERISLAGIVRVTGGVSALAAKLRQRVVCHPDSPSDCTLNTALDAPV